MLAGGPSLEQGHLTVCGGDDYLEVGLEEIDLKQPVMVRRLILRRDA